MPRLGPVAISVTTTVLAVLPVYLVAGLAGLLRADMSLSATALGIAVGAFFAVSAVASPLFGRHMEHRNPWTVVRWSVLMAIMSLVGLTALASSWMHLAVWLALAGLANALVQPTTNRVVARQVDRARHGLVFGAKQGAIPAASLLAGLSVPLLAQPLGWRPVFLLAAAFGILLVLVLPSPAQPSHPIPATSDAPRRLPGLLPTAVAAGLGACAANSVPVFITDTAIAEGVGHGVAGLLLALGSGISVVARLILGRVADKAQADRFGLLCLVMTIGAVGLALLAVVPPLGPSLGMAALVVGIALAFGGGWGWQGLLHLAVVTRYSSAPSRATGVVVSGVYVGGITGPVVLGVLIDHVGYSAAWSAAAASLLLAAIVVWRVRAARLSPVTA